MAPVEHHEDPATLREVVRELAHVALRMEQLVSKVDAGFHSIRNDMLRRDVFEGREEVLKTQIKALEEDVSVLHAAKRQTNVALMGIMLTFVSSIVLFLLTRGLTT